jgi:uncharacterized membrane protein YphA (DoxX/SURF4 family)
MLEFLKTQQSHANYSTSAMEADTISKNGRSSKSQMSRGNFLRKICFVLLAIVFIFSGCEKKGGGEDDAASGFYGTWVGNAYGFDVTIVITSSGWNLSAPSAEFYDNGTYTMVDVNTANLYSVKYGLNVGTGVQINKNTINITLNSNSIAPGTHTLTRQ